MIVSITGKPGSGKTTLLEKIIEHFDEKIGFLTKEVREKGQRIGFDAISSWGDRIVLARKGLRSRWRVGSYGVDVENFEKRIVIPLEERFENFDLIYVDEVGKMECFSKRFVSLVEKLLRSDKIIVFTIPFRDFNRTIALIRKSSDVIFETPAWRDRVNEIVNTLRR